MSEAQPCASCASRPPVFGALCEACARHAADLFASRGPLAPAAAYERTERQVIIDIPRLSAELAELQSRIRSALALVSIRPDDRITPRDFFAAQALAAITATIAANGGSGMHIAGVYVGKDLDAVSLATAAYVIADAMSTEKATRDATPKG